MCSGSCHLILEQRKRIGVTAVGIKDQASNIGECLVRRMAERDVYEDLLIYVTEHVGVSREQADQVIQAEIEFWTRHEITRRLLLGFDVDDA